MSRAAKSHPQITSVDPLWSAVRAGAEGMVDAEPAMAAFATATILNHDSFETALAYRLAVRLGNDEISGDLIRQTFDQMLEVDPAISLGARADLSATLERDPACNRAMEPFLFFKGYHAVQTHRFAHALLKAGRRDFAFYLQSRSSQVFQVDINPAVPMGKGIMVDHGTAVVIGETASVGDNVSILQGVTLGGTGKEHGDRHPKIGSGVLIGAGAKILGNIRIGDCARVAAGSVVLKDVAPHTTVAGVPARVVSAKTPDEPAQAMDQIIEPDITG